MMVNTTPLITPEAEERIRSAFPGLIEGRLSPIE